jgi:FkbM family methyltransferase
VSVSVSLELPNGAHADLVGDPDDLSVFGAVVATGMWEGDLGCLFASIVRPNWTCVDLGANIGCHTLGLAVLASEGEVIAFEASTRNFSFLQCNVASLKLPHARVTCVPLAVWDQNCILDLAGIQELAGCSFVAPDNSVQGHEAMIRDVVTNPLVAGGTLNVSNESVEAVTLDDWVTLRNLDRIDLIKIDIEGSERVALEGAERTLKRFNPILITEFNPACAETYRQEPPELYFDFLDRNFERIQVIGKNGALEDPVSGWIELRDRLKAGPGWVDLCCTGIRS